MVRGLILAATGLAGGFGAYYYLNKAPPGNDSYANHIKTHGPLRPIGSNLWQLTGVTWETPFMKFERNMVVYKLADGGLVVHNPIALDQPTKQQLESLGEIRAIIVPTPFHRMDAGVYTKEYPEAETIAPKAAVDKVKEVTNTPVVAAEDAFAGRFRNQGVNCLPVKGLREGSWPGEVFYEFIVKDEKGNETSRALAATDLWFNFDDIDTKPAIAKTMVSILSGAPSEKSSVPGANMRMARSYRNFGIKDMPAYKQSLIEIADRYQNSDSTDASNGTKPTLQYLLFGHSPTIESNNAPQILKSFANSLTKLLP